jgi:hypothetical protein
MEDQRRDHHRFFDFDLPRRLTPFHQFSELSFDGDQPSGSVLGILCSEPDTAAVNIFPPQGRDFPFPHPGKPSEQGEVGKLRRQVLYNLPNLRLRKKAASNVVALIQSANLRRGEFRERVKARSTGSGQKLPLCTRSRTSARKLAGLKMRRN